MAAPAPSQPHDRRDDDAVARRVDELIQLIRSADYAYYALDAPTLSDVEYDLAMRELRELEAGHPDQVRPDSPTRIVPSPVSAGFAKVVHLEPVLSLGNAMSEEELRRFDTKVTGVLGHASAYHC